MLINWGSSKKIPASPVTALSYLWSQAATKETRAHCWGCDSGCPTPRYRVKAQMEHGHFGASFLGLCFLTWLRSTKFLPRVQIRFLDGKGWHKSGAFTLHLCFSPRYKFQGQEWSNCQTQLKGTNSPGKHHFKSPCVTFSHHPASAWKLWWAFGWQMDIQPCSVGCPRVGIGTNKQLIQKPEYFEYLKVGKSFQDVIRKR